MAMLTKAEAYSLGYEAVKRACKPVDQSFKDTGIVVWALLGLSLVLAVLSLFAPLDNSKSLILGAYSVIYTIVFLLLAYRHGITTAEYEITLGYITKWDESFKKKE